jgi:hypothetical protein
MIDFSTLKGLTIPEGNVTKITDVSGRVIWAVQSGDKVILEVEKITSDTYAGETTYTGEQFILLDIYPKTNRTVSVTYGGLTKTITDTSGAEEPNAQQVFFGTFNGVADSVATPASGELTIEGDFYAFGCGSFQNGSKTTNIAHGRCITAVDNWGDVTIIPDYAFYGCVDITSLSISSSVGIIGESAFANTGLTSIEIPANITEIGASAFYIHKSDVVEGLKTVTVLSETPPVLLGLAAYYVNFGAVASTDCVLEKIIVPKGCGDVYKAADGWSTYADYIVEAS